MPHWPDMGEEGGHVDRMNTYTHPILIFLIHTNVPYRMECMLKLWQALMGVERLDAIQLLYLQGMYVRHHQAITSHIIYYSHSYNKDSLNIV